jgi:hypothetical protein
MSILDNNREEGFSHNSGLGGVMIAPAKMVTGNSKYTVIIHGYSCGSLYLRGNGN